MFLRCCIVLLMLTGVARAQTDEEGQVRVVGDHVEAPGGIRLESATEWSTTAPLVFGQPYMVRKANGQQYRLWLRDSNAQPEASAAGGTLRAPGRYVLTQISGQAVLSQQTSVPNLLQSAQIEENVPELVIHEGGTYQMGRTSGRWRQADGNLLLEGTYSNWGRGQPSADGNSVKFLLNGDAKSFIVLTRAETVRR